MIVWFRDTEGARALEAADEVRVVRRFSDILGFNNHIGCRSFDYAPANSVVDSRRCFDSLYVYSSMVEPRVVGDKIVLLLRIVPITGQHGENVTTRFDHVQYITVMSREFGPIETEIRDDTGRLGAFRTEKGDTTLSTAQHWPIQMNYDDYYTRQVGGALSYFTCACVQKGQCFGSLFSGVLRSIAPLIKRGALALGKRALTTGAQIAGGWSEYQ